MTEPQAHPARVAVVGCGNVGATFAYALLLSGLASEIVLIDYNRQKAEGEAMDLAHTEPFAHPTRIWAGDYPDTAGAIVTVIAAGVGQKPGETRLDLVKRNAEVMRQIVPQIARHNPDGIILMTTNPVDVLTYAAWKYSGLPPRRVFGSGTILDTARFRYLLSQYFHVDARSIHAHIIGEHGDSEVPVWSLANIGGMKLPAFCAAHGIDYRQDDMDEIFQQTRDAAYHIIKRKGATYYAVAAGLMRIVEAILRDQSTVLSLSSLVENYCGISDVCLSLPTIVNRSGVERVLRLDLSQEEVGGLRNSAGILKQTIAQLSLVEQADRAA
ncbi:MAG TPA: L-lactate dehydrogenase [Terriglobales bacterium]|nr:L-lactate dehydrogenase [Terriglobales bacterium]